MKDKILIVTNKNDEHSDLVIDKLIKFKAKYIRFNTEEFPELVKIDISINNKFNGLFIFKDCQLKFSDIKSVWFRRPKEPEWEKEKKFINKEANKFALNQRNHTLNGLWEALDCFWVSHPQKIKEAEYKIYQLKLARQLGFKIPKTIITNNIKQAKAFYLSAKEQKERIITKTLIESSVIKKNKVYAIYTNLIDFQNFNNPDEINLVPSLFQKNILKKIELRITIVGKKVYAAEIHSQESIKTNQDWRHYDFNNVPHLVHRLPIEIEEKCIKLVHKLGLNFGTIDMIVTPDNQYLFLEINPNGQWGWIEILTGLPISDSLAKLLIKGGKKI